MSTFFFSFNELVFTVIAYFYFAFSYLCILINIFLRGTLFTFYARGFHNISQCFYCIFDSTS